ncbi:MAG: o-succinylbenzoate synthase [Planctomycetota bacterium]
MRGIKAYRFQIPLQRSLPLKDRVHTERSGILLERDGRWAEASPLPGFSQETLDDVVAALRGEKAEPASLQFALNSLEQPELEQTEIPFNYLLLGHREQILEGARRCKQKGCRAAKLKVGRNSASDDIRLVRDVRKLLGSEIQLRLDANQAWSYEQAVKFQEEITDFGIEYIEEPLTDASRLEELFRQTHVPYALDESLLEATALDRFPNVAALVCKPTILGTQLIEHLLATGKKIVFSAAFESGVGITRIVQLAATHGPYTPAGLDTLDWLVDDLLLQSPRKRSGMFRVFGEPLVDTSSMEQIAL